MTGYRRTTVEGPEAAFDRLRQEFFVEEDRGDELVLIIEDEQQDEILPDVLHDPVRDLIEDEFTLDHYSAHGQGIKEQRDLPPELRDMEAYEAEQDTLEVKGVIPDLPESHISAVLGVLEAIKGEEHDHDHVRTIENAQTRIQEIYGADISPSDDDPSRKDIELTLRILREDGVPYVADGKGHENNVLIWAREFVVTYSEHGFLPLSTD